MPRCFNNVVINRLPVLYRANKKAWMAGVLYEEWLKWFDRWMRGHKVLLFVDNAPSHLSFTLRNVTVKHFPTNSAHGSRCHTGFSTEDTTDYFQLCLFILKCMYSILYATNKHAHLMENNNWLKKICFIQWQLAISSIKVRIFWHFVSLMEIVKPPNKGHLWIKAKIVLSHSWPLFTGLTVYMKLAGIKKKNT